VFWVALPLILWLLHTKELPKIVRGSRILDCENIQWIIPMSLCMQRISESHRRVISMKFLEQRNKWRNRNIIRGHQLSEG